MTTDKKTLARKARQRRIRAQISGTATRPRIAVFRSNTTMSAQVIDDVAGATIVSISTTAAKGKNMSEKVVAAGAELAKLMKAKKITEAVFDRGGYAFTGNIKALADAVREGGITF